MVLSDRVSTSYKYFSCALRRRIMNYWAWVGHKYLNLLNDLASALGWGSRVIILRDDDTFWQNASTQQPAGVFQRRTSARTAQRKGMRSAAGGLQGVWPAWSAGRIPAWASRRWKTESWTHGRWRQRRTGWGGAGKHHCWQLCFQGLHNDHAKVRFFFQRAC